MIAAARFLVVTMADTEIFREGRYSLSFDFREKYLHVVVTGKSAVFDVMNGYFRKIADKCRQHACDRVLMFNRVSQIPAFMVYFRIVSELHDMGYGNIRLAIVNELNHTPENDQFAETVAGNRQVTLRTFPTVDEAEPWLLAS
jgi:hypothetical protein